MVRRHRLSVTTFKRAIVIPDIADASIDIGEGCPLFPSVGNTADGCEGPVFHSYVGAACAIGALRHRLGMGVLREHRAGDQEQKKRTKSNFDPCWALLAPIHHGRQRNGGDSLGNYSVLSELRIS
jgi:hypothetical protein